MSITFTADHLARRVRALASGTVREADVIEYARARIAAGVYDYDQLVDLDGARFELDLEIVVDSIVELRELFQGDPLPFTALVAANDHARDFAQHLSTRLAMTGATVSTFASVDAATEWIVALRAGQPERA